MFNTLGPLATTRRANKKPPDEPAARKVAVRSADLPRQKWLGQRFTACLPPVSLRAQDSAFCRILSHYPFILQCFTGTSSMGQWERAGPEGAAMQ